MYADRKELALEQVDVTVTFDRDADKNVSNIGRTIELHGDLTPEQRERLLHIANLCPLHKTLTNPISISTQLI